MVPEQAQIVRQIFNEVGIERASLGEVQRRLKQAGIASPKGKTSWDRTTIWGILKNPAYQGTAAFGIKIRLRSFYSQCLFAVL